MEKIVIEFPTYVIRLYWLSFKLVLASNLVNLNPNIRPTILSHNAKYGKSSKSLLELECRDSSLVLTHSTLVSCGRINRHSRSTQEPMHDELSLSLSLIFPGCLSMLASYKPPLR